MIHFTGCKDLNELKTEYRKLCKVLHPDKGGTHSGFIEMQAQFDKLSTKLKFNTGFEADKDFNANKFYDLVQKFDGLLDIDISFVGSFIWLTDSEGSNGAMYRQIETIKGIKFEGLNAPRWANKKKSWYFSPEDYKQKSGSNKSLDELKSTYGNNTFQTKKSVSLSA